MPQDCPTCGYIQYDCACAGESGDVMDHGLRKDIESAINSHSAENGSDTPDLILAEYLIACLTAFDSAVNRREQWYGREPRSTMPAIPPPAEAPPKPASKRRKPPVNHPPAWMNR